MNALILTAGAALLALLTFASASLMSLSSTTMSRQAALNTSRVADLAASEVVEAVELEREGGLFKGDWPDAVPDAFVCEQQGENQAYELCRLQAGGAPSAFVCPVSIDFPGLPSQLAVGSRAGAFLKADEAARLSLSRPLAFVLELAPGAHAPGSASQANAVVGACDTLAGVHLLSTATLDATLQAQMKASGIAAWRVVTLKDVLTARSGRFVGAPVATTAELLALPSPQVGELRFVKQTEQLMRWGGEEWANVLRAGYEPEFLPAWYSNMEDANYTGTYGPWRYDVYIPIPRTTLSDGSVVPPFQAGAYEARFLRVKAADYLGEISKVSHDGFASRPYSSTPEPGPAVGLTWYQAKAACESIGAKLPTLPQWLAMATRTANAGSNWTGGAAGKGAMISGVSAATSAPAPLVGSQNFSRGWYGLPDTAATSRRTFEVSGARQGESPNKTPMLWDLGGGAAEWIDWTPTVSSLPAAASSQDYCAWSGSCGGLPTVEVLPLSMRPNHPNMPGGWLRSTHPQGLATNNVLGADGCTGECASTAAAAMGGSAQSEAGGVFTLDTRWGRNYASPFIGFRCVLPPECGPNHYVDSCKPSSVSP